MTRNAVNCVKLDFSKYLETECMCDFCLFVCLFAVMNFQELNRLVREILESKCTHQSTAMRTL